VTSPQTLLDGVMARKLERLNLVSRRRLVGQGQGDRRSLRKGSSLELADYRHYVEGDDPARVDWNIYSRTDTLFVRLYEEEEVLNVHLLVDASRSMDWGEPSKLHYARRLAATLGYVALNASNRLFVWPLRGSAGSYGPACRRPPPWNNRWRVSAAAPAVWSCSYRICCRQAGRKHWVGWPRVQVT